MRHQVSSLRRLLAHRVEFCTMLLVHSETLALQERAVALAHAMVDDVQPLIYLYAAQITAPHPARKHSPPIGVIAPSTLIPVNASAYKLPLNSTTPPRNKKPALVVTTPGARLHR